MVLSIMVPNFSAIGSGGMPPVPILMSGQVDVKFFTQERFDTIHN